MSTETTLLPGVEIESLAQLGRGDVVDADIVSTHPRRQRFTLSRTPWGSGHPGKTRLPLGPDGGVVVHRDTIRLIERVTEACPHTGRSAVACEFYDHRSCPDVRPSAVPAHTNDASGQFCDTEGVIAPGGRCPSGCDHEAHYSNDGHPGCED